jgi:hypothetical protein
LKPGVKPYAPGTRVSFSFTPTAGHAAALVILDGKLVKPKGTINMNGDHYLWAFGNPKSGKTFENVMTVPSDVTKIPYPEFYQKTPSFTFNVADPYCALTSDVVSYPTSYLGAFPMPPIVDAPLPPGVLRGVTLRDFWNDTQKYNPGLNKGCTGSMYTAYTESMKRFKRLNADHVIMFQTALLEDVNAAELRFLAKDNWVSETDLAWFVAEARAAGLNVYQGMTVGGDSKHQPLPTNPSSVWLAKYLDAWTNYLVGQARVAQRHGIRALQLDWGSYWFDMKPWNSLYVSKMTDLARRVRSVFSGKIYLGPLYIPSDPVLHKSIDWIYCGIVMWISDEDNKSISVSVVKKWFLSNLVGLANLLGADAPPIVWGLNSGSHPKALLGKFLEDAFCVPSPENCSQRKIRTDFSIQAIAYEAVLEALAEQTLLETAGVETEGYWYIDVIRPKDSFPNLSTSIRNKPAESIVYEWFKR